MSVSLALSLQSLNEALALGTKEESKAAVEKQVGIAHTWAAGLTTVFRSGL